MKDEWGSGVRIRGAGVFEGVGWWVLRGQIVARGGVFWTVDGVIGTVALSYWGKHPDGCPDGLGEIPMFEGKDPSIHPSGASAGAKSCAPGGERVEGERVESGSRSGWVLA